MAINRKACKKHSEFKYVEDREAIKFSVCVENGGEVRLINRICAGRSVMPCGKECREYGLKIATSTKHASFINFKQLMNDKEFLLEIAKISPNPKKCEDYFFQFINPHLRNNKIFRLEFLKAIYLNDDVYSVESINKAVEICDLQKENETLLNSDSFAEIVKQRLDDLKVPPVLVFNLDGKDRKAMRRHKVKQNEARIRWENQKKGLEEILKTFACNQEKEDDLFNIDFDYCLYSKNC